MKNSIKKTLLFSIMLLAFSPLFSQSSSMKSADDRAAQLTAWMKTNLKLSDEQTDKVAVINKKYANRNQSLQGSSQSKRQKFQTLKANDKEKDKELQGVLTPEQFNVYQSKKAAMKKKFKEEMQTKRQAQ